MARRGRADPPVATITLAADTVADKVLIEILEPLAEKLTERSAAPSATLSPARLSVELTLAPGAVLDTMPDALAAASEVLAALEELLGAGHGCTVMTVTIQTSQARQDALEAASRDRRLMGIRDIASWRSENLGREVAVQSIQRTVQRPQFPPPYAEVAAGKVWRELDVVNFYNREDARVRPRGTAEPTGSAPGPGHRQTLAALLLEAQERGDDLPSDLLDLGRRPHQLTGQALIRAIQALGGTRVVADRLNVAMRTVQRWVSGAEQDVAAGS